MDQDIFLITEAYRLSDNPLEAEQKCGEAIFLVFPQRSYLFPTKIPSETRSDEQNVLYKIEKQLNLTTEESGLNGLLMSVGILWLSAVLRTVVEKDLQQESPTNAENCK
jgi:hypothetical protein